MYNIKKHNQEYTRSTQSEEKSEGWQMTHEEELLQKILLEGSPILFLGAGFSLGAKQADGSDVPNGASLKTTYLIPEILKYPKTSKEYQEASSYPLSKLCSFIDDMGFSDQRRQLLVRIFKGVTPGDKHRKFFNYHWRKIYTTNIDDLIEHVFLEKGEALNVQNSKNRLDFPDGGKSNVCEYVKLHGCVNNPDEDFTFSTKEYVTSMQAQQDYRFSEFCEDILSSNIILVGTAFDEINIDYFLQLYENAGRSNRGRLVFINKYADMALRGRIKKLDALFLEWDWVKLMDFIEQIDFSVMDQAEYWKQRLQVKHFFGMPYFESLLRSNLTYRSDLYYGDEPTMLDILSDWDFIDPQWEIWASRIAAKSYSSCITITGKRLSGKSCASLRLLHYLHKAGFEVFDYTPSSFDGRMIINYVNQSPKYKFVFYIDEGAYYYREIRNTLKQYKGPKVILILVSSCFDSYYKWRYYLQTVDNQDYRLDGSISDALADDILNKLNAHGQLGHLGGMTPAAQKQEILESEDLMSFLMKLSDSDGFLSRFEGVIYDCINSNPEYKRLFVLLLLFDQRNLPYIPASCVSVLFGRSAGDLLNHTSDIYRTYRNLGYRIRGGMFGKRLLKMVTKEMLIEGIEQIAQVISPQVFEHEKNYCKNILESLIKPKEIYRQFAFNKTQKMMYREMLYRLKPYYEKISYYWVQLGLAEQLAGDFDRALTHFRHAESIRPRSYSVLHAIARNYIRRANRLTFKKRNDAKQLFETGEAKMLDLIREQEYEQNIPYSIHTYIWEKIDFCRKFKFIPSTEELRYMDTLCKDLEAKDIEDISRPVKKHFYGYLQSIGRMDILGSMSLQDLGMLVKEKAGGSIFPDDPEDD